MFKINETKVKNTKHTVTNAYDSVVWMVKLAGLGGGVFALLRCALHADKPFQYGYLVCAAILSVILLGELFTAKFKK